MSRSVLPESVALASLALLDLIVSTFLLATGAAWEGNIWMGSVLERYGPTAFVAIKALFVAGPIAVAELGRRRYPHTVRLALRAALVGYALLWLLGIARFNRWV